MYKLKLCSLPCPLTRLSPIYWAAYSVVICYYVPFAFKAICAQFCVSIPALNSVASRLKREALRLISGLQFTFKLQIEIKLRTWSSTQLPAHTLPPWLLTYWDHLKQSFSFIYICLIFVKIWFKKKKVNFILIFDLKCECYCHLRCPVKPKEIYTMALTVVNHNIYILYVHPVLVL